MWNDGPGHGWGVDPAHHPEHAEPAHVFTALLTGQNLRKVREHDGTHRQSCKDIIIMAYYILYEFSASLLQSSVSHDPSEIILICWFADKFSTVENEFKNIFLCAASSYFWTQSVAVGRVTFDPLFETDRSDCAAALIQSGVTALLQGQETTLKFNKQ